MLAIEITTLSPAFLASCKTLLQMADTEGLGDGYAVFGPDLGGEGRWYVDLPTAQMSSDGDEVFVRVPNPPGDRVWVARANLIAGLVFNIEEARSFQELVPQAAEKYAEREIKMLAHLNYTADAAPAVTLTRAMRNVLAGMAAMHMSWAGESIEGGGAEASARMVALLTPLRDVLGWQRKAKKKAKKQSWEVPADLLAEVLPVFLAEAERDLAISSEAAERRRSDGDVRGESLARTDVAAANRDHSYLLELKGMLDDAGVKVDVEGGRS